MRATETELLLPTRFAWECLGAPDYPPPAPSKKGQPRYALSERCWLCGGLTEGIGWPRTLAIAETFTNHNQARCPTSDALCQPCAFIGRGETFRAYVTEEPERGLKAGHAMGWPSYSHVFAAGLHDTPQRSGWRQWLTEPPEPPFLFLLAESGKKHLCFRARVSTSRAAYYVQAEEDTLLIEQPLIAQCLADVEALLALGCSREAVLTGHYASLSLQKAGLRAWREAERPLLHWRTEQPDYLRLATFCARRSA